MALVNEEVIAPNYRLLFESCPHPYLVLLPNPSFTIVAVNDRYLAATGTERDRIIGRGLFDVLPDTPSDVTATGVSDLRKSLDRVLRDKIQDVMGVPKFDIPRHEADGTFAVKYWSPVNTPVFDCNGLVVMIIHHVEDITAREQAQAELATSEKAFRFLAEAMPQIVWITRADGGNIYFNHQWVDYTGMTLEESYGAGWNKPFHPDDQQRAWDAWQNAVTTNGIYSLECRLRRADGEYRWWLVRGVPAFNENGSIEKWFGTCTDIHDLKDTAESLRLSALVYEASSDSMIVTDADGTVIAVNPAFTAITGYTRDEAIGHPSSLFESARQDDNFYKAMWASIHACGQWEGEVRDFRKNGEAYFCKVVINTVYSDSGSVFRRVALASDITEQKKVFDSIWQHANFDTLTGLPNRRMFIDQLEHEIKKANRTNTRMALMFIDLDMFKEVNDSLGHDIGDFLLKMVATRLIDCVREVDVVARFGGDEFTLLMGELEDLDAIDRVAATVVEKLATPFQLKDNLIHISASIGIAIYPDDATEPAELLQCADCAMYESKRLGRNRSNYFKFSI